MSILESKIKVLHELVNSIDPAVSGGLDTLQALRMIAETAESAQTQAADLARAQGESYARIGKALGISRQAAYTRFSTPATSPDGLREARAYLNEMKYPE